MFNSKTWELSKKKLIKILNAGVEELVDTPDLESGAARCGSSSPPPVQKSKGNLRLFLF